MRRLRSVSNQSQRDEYIEIKEIKPSQYAKRAVPLHQENSMLKDRLNQLKFEVEDNLQSVIDNLDSDLQLKAKLIDSKQIFRLIKEQINKDHEKIENQHQQIERLQFNIKQIVEQQEEDSQYFQKKNQQLADQLQNEKQTFKNEKIQLEKQIKALNCVNYEQEVLLGQVKRDLQRELDINTQNQAQIGKCNELEVNIKNQKTHFETIIQKLQNQIDVDNQVFKNELEIQQQRIEHKYKQIIEENKQLTQQVSEMKQYYHQIKQQKESIEKTLDQNNQKMKDIKSVVITDKQTMSKNEKIIDELQKELTFFKNKVQIEEKREAKLKEQIESNEDQIVKLQQQNLCLNNIQKSIDQQHNQHIQQIEARHQEAIKNVQNQIQIQKVKYEKLLGNKNVTIETEQYKLVDYSSQYDDPVQILYIQNLEKIKEDQEKEISNLHLNIQQLEQEHQQEKLKIQEENENQKKILIDQQKQDLQRQLAQFEELKNKIQSDCSYKLQLYSQQYSFQLDQQKQEQRQLQQIIDQSKLSSDEKTKLLEVASEEIMQLRKKYDHDMYEEKSLQKQQKHEFDNIIFNIKQENSKKVETLKREIENLQNKLNESQNKEQNQRQRISQLQNEQQQDKAQINQLELQVSRKLNEIQKLNDTIKGLNTKISVLLLEVENAKKTYNIFAPPTSHSSHGNIKKIELELPISISLNQQRHSSSDLKFKLEPHQEQLPKKSNRNFSSSGHRHYQIRQLPQV